MLNVNLIFMLGEYTHVKLFYISYFIMIGLRVEVYVYGNNFIDKKENQYYGIMSLVSLLLFF